MSIRQVSQVVLLEVPLNMILNLVAMTVIVIEELLVVSWFSLLD